MAVRWRKTKNLDIRNKSGYSRPYDRWDREDNTENRMYKNTMGNNRDAETKKIDNKQSEFSEN